MSIDIHADTYFKFHTCEIRALWRWQNDGLGNLTPDYGSNTICRELQQFEIQIETRHSMNEVIVVVKTRPLYLFHSAIFFFPRIFMV